MMSGNQSGVRGAVNTDRTPDLRKGEAGMNATEQPVTDSRVLMLAIWMASDQRDAGNHEAYFGDAESRLRILDEITRMETAGV